MTQDFIVFINNFSKLLVKLVTILIIVKKAFYFLELDMEKMTKSVEK